MRKTNVRIIGPPGGLEKEKGPVRFREIVTELPKSGEGTGQVQEANTLLSQCNKMLSKTL